MSQDEIKNKYRSTLTRGKVVSAIFIILALPKLVIGFTDYTSVLGIEKLGALALFVIGTLIYCIFFFVYWKCPACRKYPGGGWRPSSCKSCGAELGDA